MTIKEIAQKFGGTTKMAAALGVPITTIYNWIKSNKFPKWRVDAIKSVAAAHNLDLTDYFNGGAK